MAERGLSIAELRTVCQEHKWANSRGLTRLNRYVSVYVTALVIRTRLSANSITVGSILLGLVGSALFLAEAHGARLAGVGALYLSFLFDQVDGEVARYWNSTSLGGAFLDEVRHILIYAAPVFAVGLRLVMDGGPPLVAAAGCACALSLSILRFGGNAKYLLVAKKLLAAANGAVQPTRSRRRPTSVHVLSRGTRAVVKRLIAGLSYVATNQVSILLLLLAFQLSAPRTGLRQLILLYVGYSVVLTVLTVINIRGISRTRLDLACAELMSQLQSTGVWSAQPSDEKSRHQ